MPIDGRNDEAYGNLDDPCNPRWDHPNGQSALDGHLPPDLRGAGHLREPAVRRGARLDELVAKSTGTTSEFSLDDRVFHQKFGYGNVVKIDGNKLTIAFEKAGEKKVVDSFVERV